MVASNSVTVGIDGKWELEDFGVFSKQYTQCYALLYSLNQKSFDSVSTREGVDFEYAKYPWRGGFSVINFYYSLYHRIPEEQRPRVKRIAYNSPGSITLSAVVEVALQLGVLITIVSVSLSKLNDLYSSIQKGIQDRKLGRIEVEAKQLQLSNDQLEFITKSIVMLSQALQLSPALLQALDARTKGNKLVQLKVLLSLYRRIEPLAELAKNEMLSFDPESNDGSRDA